MRTILFIINPISGGISKTSIPDLIHQELDTQIFIPTIIFTEYSGHAKVLAQQAAIDKVDIVVAVGGDGTINEIASELVNSEVALAVIPKGSGNGLARHLSIPLDTKKAIACLNTANVKSIDVGQLNDRLFFCTSGIGFDAHVSEKFAQLTKRGLWGYLKTSILSFVNYKPETYAVNIDGRIITSRAFLITFANASQFGNNAYIAPLADISDGLLDISIMKTFTFAEIANVGWKLFSKNIHLSKYVTIFKAKHITIERATAGAAHIDGEPISMKPKIEVTIHHLALKVMVSQL